jgi:hypothetical protein
MRNWSSHLIFVVLVAALCRGQQPRATVNVSATGGPPYDTRPFGKYLVEICTISGKTRTITCSELPFPAAAPIGTPAATPQPKDQTLTLKLVCDPDKKTDCDLANPKVGDNFFVSGTSDSGLPVTQNVFLGSATSLGGTPPTIRYRANAEGPIIIRATAAATAAAPGTPAYAEAVPVDLILQVRAASASADNHLAAGKSYAFHPCCPRAQYYRYLFHAAATARPRKEYSAFVSRCDCRARRT